LKKKKDMEGGMQLELFSKKKPTGWKTVNISKKEEWIVFPWENKMNFQNDRNAYIKQRGIS